MKRILNILFLAVCLLNTIGLGAQELGSWQLYPSYGRATQNVSACSVVYAVFEGQLLRYDTEDSSVKVYSTLTELSDANISYIAYCKEAKRLTIVYDNGNIDLLDEKGRILNIAALKDKVMANKQVTALTIQGLTAYLATGFGYVEVDVAEGVIRDTYQLDLQVRGVVATDESIYLSTATGLYKGTVGTNLHLAASWQRINPSSNFYEGVLFGDVPVFRHVSGLYQVTDNGQTLREFLNVGALPSFLSLLSDGSMVFAATGQLYRFVSKDNYSKTEFPGTLNDLCLSNQLFWTCEGDEGMKGYKWNDGALELAVGAIRPNGPHRNLFSAMSYVPNGEGDYRLLVAGGLNSMLDDRLEPLAMYLDGGQWTLLDDAPASELLPGVGQYNTTNVVQDPNEVGHFYAGTWRNGLKEYRNDRLIHIYNSDNSLLQSILPESSHYHNYEPVASLRYDEDGNLWMAQQMTDTVLRYISPDRKWHALYQKDLAQTRQVREFLFAYDGITFMPCCVTVDPYVTGIFAFRHNGKKVTSSIWQTELKNQDDVSYGQLDCQAMVEDMTGIIWCATTEGLFVIENPESFLSSGFRFTQIKINRNDGSGLADYLLSGVNITALAVDGANRKWVGTSNNGVYLISADGQEMLQHFYMDNSPILSNKIQCIAVHPLTGEVMIGTDVGLCSYMSDATEGEDVLSGSNVVAYPNPVTPDYRGSVRIDGLTFGSEVKILSSAGQLVGHGYSNGGTFTWDCQKKQGGRVASGVYHVVANTEDGKKAVVTRIIVIR